MQRNEWMGGCIENPIDLAIRRLSTIHLCYGCNIWACVSVSISKSIIGNLFRSWARVHTFRFHLSHSSTVALLRLCLQWSTFVCFVCFFLSTLWRLFFRVHTQAVSKFVSVEKWAPLDVHVRERTRENSSKSNNKTEIGSTNKICTMKMRLLRNWCARDRTRTYYNALTKHTAAYERV